jgi:hypothetical protein
VFCPDAAPHVITDDAGHALKTHTDRQIVT